MNKKLLFSFIIVLMSFSTLSAKDKLLRHVVLFTFKADATEKQIKEVEDAFKALPGKIKAIADFEWGTFVEGEKLNKGFTHCFFVSFKTKKDLDEGYIPHEDHVAFVAILKPILEDVLVFDYWMDK